MCHGIEYRLWSVGYLGLLYLLIAESLDDLDLLFVFGTKAALIANEEITNEFHIERTSFLCRGARWQSAILVYHPKSEQRELVGSLS